MSNDDWMHSMRGYYDDWDPVTKSKAGGSRWDALPSRKCDLDGPSRYRRDTNATSTYRAGRQTTHERTSRDWGAGYSPSSSRRYDRDSVYRSKTMSSACRPETRRGSSSRYMSKKESTLFEPGLDLFHNEGGYGRKSSVGRSSTVRGKSDRDRENSNGAYDDYGGKTSSIGRSRTFRDPDNRKSVSRDSINLSAMNGGPGHTSSYDGRTTGYDSKSFASRMGGGYESGYGGGGYDDYY